MTRVIVTFDDGFKLPLEGPNVDKTLKGPNPEKVFKDKAKELYPKKNPASWGIEGETPAPFIKSDKKTDKPTGVVKPENRPVEVKPQVKPAPPDSTINDIVTQREKEAADAKKAAAEAEKKARETKDAEDKAAALKAQQEARIAQEKADQATKDAKEKQDIIDAFKKDGETRAEPAKTTTVEPAKTTTAEPAKVTTAEPAKVTTAEPAKTTTAEPAKTTTAEPAKTTTAEPAKTTTAEPAKTTTAEPVKSNEPEGPSLWDKIKSGAKDIGQAIGGALTPSSEPAQTSAPPAPTSAPPSKEQLKSEIEKKLDELDKSPDPEVRKRAQAARDKLNGQPGGTGSGAKVPSTGPNPGGGGKADIDKTSRPGTDGTGTGQGPKPGTGPGKSFDNPTGTQPGPGTGPEGAPGDGTAPGNAPGAVPGPGNNPTTGSDVDGDKIRKQRRDQENELKRLKALPDKNANTSPGGWRDAGFGTKVWRGGPGKDPQGKWKDYVFNDGDIMPAGNYSTGVGNSRTTTYSGNAGTDQFDRQGVDKLLYDRERQAQEIERLKKQKGVNEDVNRILKLAGLNK